MPSPPMAGGAHSFAWQFSHLLPLPILSVVRGGPRSSRRLPHRSPALPLSPPPPSQLFSAFALTVAMLIVMKYLYPATFIAMIAVSSATAAGEGRGGGDARWTSV